MGKLELFVPRYYTPPPSFKLLSFGFSGEPNWQPHPFFVPYPHFPPSPLFKFDATPRVLPPVFDLLQMDEVILSSSPFAPFLTKKGLFPIFIPSNFLGESWQSSSIIFSSTPCMFLECLFCNILSQHLNQSSLSCSQIQHPFLLSPPSLATFSRGCGMIVFQCYGGTFPPPFFLSVIFLLPQILPHIFSSFFVANQQLVSSVFFSATCFLFFYFFST